MTNGKLVPSHAILDSEVIIGLVGPVGTNFERFEHALRRRLVVYGYGTNVVRLSALIDTFRPPAEVTGGATEPSSEAVRLQRLMKGGNDLRRDSKRADFLALAAAAVIRRGRSGGEALDHQAHILRSLKHPEEVRTLRKIYGNGFYLIGVTSDEEERRDYLVNEKGCSPEWVEKGFERDESEEDRAYIDSETKMNFGQRTRDAFHLADAFISQDRADELERFLDLVFGAPFVTPTPDEYAMFLAFSASLRSGDLSRQVGAVITTEHGDIVAVGANDVPKAGGGLYWAGHGDQRDHVRGGDANERMRDSITADVVARLRPDGVDAAAWTESARMRLAGSPLQDITEYGRATHAEMEALLSCARAGISTRECLLYTTTFPCHNCAKHIIAAGIRRVVFVEPYPKSQAADLFSDSIVVGRGRGSAQKRCVRFEPFVGVGPRRFVDLFSMELSSGTKLRRKGPGGRRTEWIAAKAIPRVPLLTNSYLQREQLAVNELEQLVANGEGTT